ncbi:Ig-like domain repeat protein [Peterkaempfera bronchialis]|nr:Ig-like domain repeat protein [Peterkaempfera bronchialis]
MSVPLVGLAQAPAHADGTSAQTFVVDNSTGSTQDGTPMGSPGVKVGDTYYTVGGSAIAASAGGSSNLVLYGGKDWSHKQPVHDADGNEIVIAGPDTHFKDPNTGDEIYPFANAKSERVAFSRTPNGKFIVWVHWEMNSDYNASETLGLIADKVTGPYSVYQNHQRPGAGTVDAKGGHHVKSLDDSVLPSADLNTDNPEAFGDRVGRLIGDPYSIGVDGNRLEKPAEASYPEAIQLYNTSNGGSPEVNGSSVNPVRWETRAGWNVSGDAGFGTSATGGNWWTFNFNDLKDTLRLKARAVRMTDWDTSAWTAAQAKRDPNGDNGNLTAGTYVQRYPAVKTDDPANEGKYAAGVDGSAYVGRTTDGVDAVVYPQDAPAGGGSSQLTFTPCAGDGNLSFAVSFQEGTSGHFVCDGDSSDASRWSTYNQSNASATFTFAQGYIKGGKATVKFSEQAPDGILVEGRAAGGDWKQLGTTSVGKKLGTYDVTLDPSIAFDQARVTLQGQWMKANEITFSGLTTVGPVSIGGITYGAGASKVSGFDPSTLAYKVSVPDLTAIGEVKAVNPQGTATVDQPAKANNYVATITVKSADGSVVKTYTVTFAQSDSSAIGAYDPNVKDSIFPEVGEIDASKTMSTLVSVDMNKPSDGAGAAKPAAPLISPQLSENNVGGVLVLRGNSDPQKADAIYATNTSPATYDGTIWLTNDGSDPTDPNNPNRIAYNTRWNPYPIVVTQGNNGSTLVDGEFTIKAATQTGSEDTGDLKYSDVVSQTFRYAKQGTSEYGSVPIFQPVSSHPAGSYQNSPGYQEIKVFEPTYGTEVYYTMDNSTPTPARYGQNIGYGSRDYTIINDTVESGGDGKAYFITAADDQYMRVWQLNDNMTAVVSDKEYDLDVGKHREAPQLIRGPHGTHLYLLTSGQSGWYKNQAEYQRTTGRFISDGFDNSAYPRDKYGYRDGSGAWTNLQPFADGTTYNSQVGGAYNLGTKDDPNYLFSGSHWVVGDLEDSFSIWLPMTIDDDADGSGAQVSDQLVSVEGRGNQGKPATSSFPAYKSDKGLVTVKYSGKVFITLDADGKGKVTTDPTEENIKFAVPDTYADLQKPEFKANPDNHTPRVIDYQREQQFDPEKCDIPDTNGWQTCNDGVSGESRANAATWTNGAGYLLGTDDRPLKDANGNLIRDPRQVADQSLIKRTSLKDAGIIRNYSIKAAFDGKDWDLDNYDGNEELYQGTGNDFFTTFDLGQKRDLSTIGLSFKSVGGSDNAHRYGIYATNDVDANGKPTNWRIIANNKQNNVPGFQAHNLDGDTYRYVKYANVDNVDMSHGKTGQAWSRGLYELTISAKKVIPLEVTALRSAVAQGTTLSQMTDTFTAKSLAALGEKLTVAQSLLDELQLEGTATKHTQDEVDTATTQLTNAIKNLRTAGSTASVDFAALAKAIDDGQAKLDQSANYTPESIKVLQKAVDQGKNILAQVDDPNLKQAQVDEATAKIDDALAGLALATTGPEIKKVSVADGDTVKGRTTFTVTLGGDAKDVSYTYIELNKGASHVWVTDNTKAPGSTNSGLKPTLVVDTETLPNGSYGLKIDAVGTNGRTTEKTVSFVIANKGRSTVAAAASSTKFGTSAKVTVKVTGPGGTPTGTIRVTDGKALVGSAKLASGKATVTVSKTLAVGSHTLTVAYSGDKAFKASTGTVKVKVAKTSSKTAVSVSPKSPKHTQKATVTAQVTTVKPAGSVVIKVTQTVKETVVKHGRKVTTTTTRTVVSKTLTVSSKGKASLTLPKLAKGTYTVTATYSGSSTATSSKAGTVLIVK